MVFQEEGIQPSDALGVHGTRSKPNLNLALRRMDADRIS